jgi:protein gp37
LEEEKEMGKSNISYLDWVWNPITGCSGKGCQAHCYARESVRTFSAIHAEKIEGFGGTWDYKPDFSKVIFHPDRLNEPLRRKKRTVYGVGFFGDFFDSQVELGWQVKTYEVIRKCPQHEFIILTKQSANMVDRLEGGDAIPNVWHGTTVTTQAEADERIPDLLKVPGKKWISIEPMLGPIDFRKVPGFNRTGLDLSEWSVVLGGESGPKARPMHPDWARSVRDQCAAAGVPFCFKQWGEWIPYDSRYGTVHSRNRLYTSRNTLGKRNEVCIAYGGVYFERVGLKSAGRLLDGRLHDDLPWRKVA